MNLQRAKENLEKISNIIPQAWEIEDKTEEKIKQYNEAIFAFTQLSESIEAEIMLRDKLRSLDENTKANVKKQLLILDQTDKNNVMQIINHSFPPIQYLLRQIAELNNKIFSIWFDCLTDEQILKVKAAFDMSPSFKPDNAENEFHTNT